MMNNIEDYFEESKQTAKNIFKNINTIGLSKAEKKFIRIELAKPKYIIEIKSDININIARKKSLKYIKKWRRQHIHSTKSLNRYIIAHIRHNMSNYNTLIEQINNLAVDFKIKNEMIKRIKRKINKQIRKRYEKLR